MWKNDRRLECCINGEISKLVLLVAVKQFFFFSRCFLASNMRETQADFDL